MPRYRLTAPDGRTVIVSGDTPPTQADAEKIFSELPAKPAVPIKNEAVMQPAQPDGSLPSTRGPGGLPGPDATFADFMAWREKAFDPTGRVAPQTQGELDAQSQGGLIGSAMIGGAALGGMIGPATAASAATTAADIAPKVLQGDIPGAGRELLEDALIDAFLPGSKVLPKGVRGWLIKNALKHVV